LIKSKKAFGDPLHKFGQVQRYIADGYAMTEAAKALTYNVARDVTPDTQNRIGTDAAKLFAAPVGKIVSNKILETVDRLFNNHHSLAGG